MQLASSRTLYASCSSLPSQLKKNRLSQVSDWEFVSFAFPTWVRSEKEIKEQGSARSFSNATPIYVCILHHSDPTPGKLVLSARHEHAIVPLLLLNKTLAIPFRSKKSNVLLLWVVVWVTDSCIPNIGRGPHDFFSFSAQESHLFPIHARRPLPVYQIKSSGLSFLAGR